MKSHLPFLLIPILLMTLFWSTDKDSTEILVVLKKPMQLRDDPEDPVVVARAPAQLPPRAVKQMAQAKPGQRFVVSLGNGESAMVSFTSSQRTVTGGKVLRGSFPRQAGGSTLWVQEGGRWAGTMNFPDGRRFTLMPRSQGGYELERVDLSRSPTCASGQLVYPSEEELATRVRPLPEGLGQWSPREPLRRLNPEHRPRDENYQRINLRTFPRGYTNRGRQSQVSLVPFSNRKNKNKRPVGEGGSVTMTSTQISGGGDEDTMASGKPSVQARQPLKINMRGGTQVDLLVLYCRSVASVYGGDNGLKAAAQLAVQNANEAFSKSGANVSLRMVHLAPVNYTNAGSISQDLRNLTFKDKMLADEMNRLRDEHRADLVTLISDRPAGGVGWLMIRAKGMAKMGVNVLGRSSLRGYVLAHEVGHNMGCQHAEGDSGTSADGLYAWGYGHRFQVVEDNGGSRQCRTVMAYTPGRRIGRFSNPNKLYRGVATGSESANNVKVLNAGVEVVSGYR